MWCDDDGDHDGDDDDDHGGDDDELKGERGEQPLQSRHRLQEEDWRGGKQGETEIWTKILKFCDISYKFLKYSTIYIL